MPEHRARELVSPRRTLHRHPGAVEVGTDRTEADRGPGSGPEAHDAHVGTKRPQVLGEPHAIGIIPADHRRPAGTEQIREEFPLGLEVGVEPAVKIEMVAGEVREDRRLEDGPREPSLPEAVRGTLDRSGAAAGSEGGSQQGLQLGSLAGGEARSGGLQEPAAHPRAVPYRAAVEASCRFPIEELVEQPGHGRFAIRPGDSHEPHPF